MTALVLDNLSVVLETRSGRLPAVSEVSLAVEVGETLALVGESGCGKTMTALAVMRLLPEPPARLAGGRVLLDGVDITVLPERAMQDVRGRSIAMVFQDPMSALNPVATVGAQVAEVLRRHEGLSAAAA